MSGACQRARRSFWGDGNVPELDSDAGCTSLCIYWKLLHYTLKKHEWCCCSVTLSCLTLCDPTDCSTPGFPVLHHLPELAQTQHHWVSDAIQPHYNYTAWITLLCKLYLNEAVKRISVFLRPVKINRIYWGSAKCLREHRDRVYQLLRSWGHCQDKTEFMEQARNKVKLCKIKKQMYSWGEKKQIKQSGTMPTRHSQPPLKIQRKE